MQAVKAEMEARGLRPVFRNPAYFKLSEIEKADGIAIGEEHPLALEISTAYESLGALVALVPAPEPVVGDIATLHITVESPEVKELLATASQRLDEMAALLNEKDTRIGELEARIAELEAELDADVDSDEIDTLKAKIADLEAKKASGTMTKTEPALLGRYAKKLAALTGAKE